MRSHAVGPSDMHNLLNAVSSVHNGLGGLSPAFSNAGLPLGSRHPAMVSPPPPDPDPLALRARLQFWVQSPVSRHLEQEDEPLELICFRLGPCFNGFLLDRVQLHVLLYVFDGTCHRQYWSMFIDVIVYLVACDVMTNYI